MDKVKFDLDMLRKICTESEEWFFKFGEVHFLNKQKDRYFIYKDNGAKVLAVAHLDIAGQLDRKPFHFFKEKGNPIVRNANLDDRLGAFYMLHQLPLMGMPVDWLLTTDEEIGVSTAENFQDWWLDQSKLDKGKHYNWIVQFDRHGLEPVTYQYSDSAWDGEIEKHIGGKLPKGTFTCIRKLDKLGCKAVNWAAAYVDEHSQRSQVDLTHAARVIRTFESFYRENVDVFWPHKYVAEAPHQSYFSYRDWDTDYIKSWKQCRSCGKYRKIASYDQLCEDCLKKETSTTQGNICDFCGKQYDKNKEVVRYLDIFKYLNDGGFVICDDCAKELRVVKHCDWCQKQENYLYPLDHNWVCETCYKLYFDETKPSTHDICVGCKQPITTATSWHMKHEGTNDFIRLCDDCHTRHKKDPIDRCDYCGEYEFGSNLLDVGQGELMHKECLETRSEIDRRLDRLSGHKACAMCDNVVPLSELKVTLLAGELVFLCVSCYNELEEKDYDSQSDHATRPTEGTRPELSGAVKQPESESTETSTGETDGLLSNGIDNTEALRRAGRIGRAIARFVFSRTT